MFGLPCLEAAVDAAALHFGLGAKASHLARLMMARTLNERHGLPDVSRLLEDLNCLRQSEAYADVEEPPKLQAREVVIEIQGYTEAVFRAMGPPGSDVDE